MSIYNLYARTWNDGKKGFGRHSYNDAISAGFTPQQIAAAVEGKRIGERARDLIAAYEQTRSSGQDEGRSEGRQSAAADYAPIIDEYKSRISDYDKQISGYKTDIDNFRSKVDTLTSQYNTALSTAKENALARDDYMKRFSEASALHEMAQAEADRYREEAVGQQLRAVRSGASAGGANQTNQMRGSLASGKTGYSADRDEISDLAESMKSQGGLTDSVLSREGPVVQQLSSGSGRGAGGGQRQATNRAGSGSYYASRFR